MAVQHQDSRKSDLAQTSLPLGITFVQAPKTGCLIIRRLTEFCRVAAQPNDIILGIMTHDKFIRFWKKPDKPNGDILIAANEDSLLNGIYVKRDKEIKYLPVFETHDKLQEAKVQPTAISDKNILLNLSIFNKEAEGNRSGKKYLEARQKLNHRLLDTIDEEKECGHKIFHARASSISPINPGFP